MAEDPNDMQKTPELTGSCLSERDWQQQIFERNKKYYENDLSTDHDGELCIRLLQLQPGSFIDPVVAILTTERLCEGLTYEALSYTWGKRSSDKEYSITVDGKAGFRVTPNAFEALRRIRDTMKVRPIWIDAVCICQTNMREKNQQVSAMGKIYSFARCVLCWLGSCGAGSDVAECTDHPVVQKQQGEDEIECRNSVLLVVDEDHKGEWWRRIWTVQESCLARSVQVLIGPHVYEFETFLSTLESHYYERPRNKLWPTNLTMATFDLGFRQDIMKVPEESEDSENSEGSRPGITRLGLYHCLTNTQEFNATEPKDKIFGLAGLSNDTIEVDYSKSLVEVCIEAAATVFEMEGHMEILIDDWPHFGPGNCSWVPDFSKPAKDYLLKPQGMTGWEGDFEPCPGELDYSIQGQNLIVRGVHLDRIVLTARGLEENGDFVLALSTEKEDPITRTTMDQVEQLTNLVRAFVEHCDSPSPYEDSMEAFRRTILCDRGPDMSETDSTDSKSEHNSQDSDQASLGSADSKHDGSREASADNNEELQPEDLEEELRERCFFVTSRGSFGIGNTTDVRLGDGVALIPKVSQPVLLRSVGEGYLFVTETYVYGAMNGELKDCWRDGRYELETITLV